MYGSHKRSYWVVLSVIRMRGLLALLLALNAPSIPCLAADWLDYRDFRGMLGLPGSGFGVTNEGTVGFDGGFHTGIPCAYTPAAGNYSGSYSVLSWDSAVRFGSGGDAVNATGHLGIGLGKPGNGLYISQTFVEERVSVNCWNVQYQVFPEDGQRPALAVGVLDVFNERIGRRRTPHGGRSVYAVASKELIGGAQPLFGSLGIGSDRFHGVFGGLTWYPWERLNLGMEYDGFVVSPHVACELYASDAWALCGTLAWSDFDHPLVGLAVTFGQ